MDATGDYPPSPYLFDVDASESALSTPEPNLSDSLRLSNAAHFSNSSDVVCISSVESDKPPPQKKKLTDFFKPAKTDEFFSDCRLCAQVPPYLCCYTSLSAPQPEGNCVFVNVIASNCCLYSEFEPAISSQESTPKFHRLL